MSSLCVTLQVGLGSFFKGIYDNARGAMANPLKFVGDRKVALENIEVAEGEYHPDSYRDEIGDVIIMALVIFVASVVILAIAL